MKWNPDWNLKWNANWKTEPTDAEVWDFVILAIAAAILFTLMIAGLQKLERPIHDANRRRALLALTSPRPAPARQLRADLRRRPPPR